MAHIIYANPLALLKRVTMFTMFTGVGGGGGLVFGAVAKHQGVLPGKCSSMGRGVLSPLPIFVIAEVNCPRLLRYQSW